MKRLLSILVLLLLCVPSVIRADEYDSTLVNYDIEENLISYTVIYQCEDGTELGRDEYMGKIGEKPIVTALHFEGYQPDAYSRTGTLSESGENIFVFTYHVDENVTSSVPVQSDTSETENVSEDPIEIIDEDVPKAAPEQLTGNGGNVDGQEEMLGNRPGGNQNNTYAVTMIIIGQFIIIMITLIAMLKRKEIY